MCCCSCCRVTNTASKPVYLDQVLLQYWFHGPLDGTVSDNSTAPNSSNSSGVSDVVARVSASQFRLTCSDASEELGTWAQLEAVHCGVCRLDVPV